MPNYSIYKTQSGEIVRQIACPAELIVLQVGVGEAVYPGFPDPAVYYVDAGVLREREVMPVSIDKLQVVANGIDTVTISGIPGVAERRLVRVNRVPYRLEAGDPVFELTTDMPGEYRVSVVSPPYLDKEWIVEAVADA